VPSLVAEVILMLVRYLTVLVEQATSLRRAASSRGAAGWGRALPWGTRSHRKAGAGMIAVLFRDAMDRATHIHQAMLARGFQGRFPALHASAWTLWDVALVAASAAMMTGVQWAR
jgi:cobalt/nickel transport system permease protein